MGNGKGSGSYNGGGDNWNSGGNDFTSGFKNQGFGNNSGWNRRGWGGQHPLGMPDYSTAFPQKPGGKKYDTEENWHPGDRVTKFIPSQPPQPPIPPTVATSSVMPTPVQEQQPYQQPNYDTFMPLLQRLLSSYMYNPSGGTRTMNNTSLYNRYGR